jgi:hypothetical protein
MKCSLARCVLEPILKVAWIFGTSSLHLSNFERFQGSKIGYVLGTSCPISLVRYEEASLAHPF